MKSTPKKAPVTADSVKAEFINCLPPGAENPTEKEIKAFTVIMQYHPGFKDNPKGIQLLAKLYADDQKRLLNTMYQTAEHLRKNSRNGAS